MDTNDLSRDTHMAIIETSDRFHHDLTLRFGVLAGNCDTDDMFLEKSEKMIERWLTNWDLDELIMDIFFDYPPRKKEFKNILDNLLTNIDTVRKIPVEHRKFDLW